MIDIPLINGLLLYSQTIPKLERDSDDESDTGSPKSAHNQQELLTETDKLEDSNFQAQPTLKVCFNKHWCAFLLCDN